MRHGSGEGVDQHPMVDWFGKVREDIGRGIALGKIEDAAHQNDRRGETQFAYPPDQRGSGHLRHHEVGENRIIVGRLQEPKRSLGSRSGIYQNVMQLVRDDSRENLEHSRVIVND